MFHYLAFGLHIASDLRLSELMPYGGPEVAPPDVTISLASVEMPPLDRQGEIPCVDVEGAVARLAWPTIGCYEVIEGRCIRYSLWPDADPDLLRLPILSTVMAVLLHQRGLLVLHGSAMAVASQGAVFLGNKGEGKSTLAATLCARGHRMLTDDIVGIEAGEPAMLIPGFPQIKLWPDAARSLWSEDAPPLPRLAVDYDKRDFRSSDGFAHEPVPLRRVYVLGESEAPEITVLSRQESITSLIGHSHAARFGQKMLQGQFATNHLSQCCQLIKAGTVRSLRRPRSLQLLNEVASMVERDMTAGDSGATDVH